MRAAFLVVILFSVTFLLPQAQATTVVDSARYMNYDQFISEAYDFMGGAGSVNPYCALIPYYSYNPGGTDYGSDTHASPSTRKYQWGIRVYETQWNDSMYGSPTEITSGSPVAIVQRDVDGEGLQNGTWTASSYNFTFSTWRLFIAVYQRDYVTSWLPWTLCVGATLGLPCYFGTESMTYPTLSNSTWTATYYTYRSTAGAATTGRFYWGDDGAGTIYESKIENIQYDNGVEPSGFYSGFMLGGVLCGLVALAAILIGEKKD